MQVMASTTSRCGWEPLMQDMPPARCSVQWLIWSMACDTESRTVIYKHGGGFLEDPHDCLAVDINRGEYPPKRTKFEVAYSPWIRWQWLDDVREILSDRWRSVMPWYWVRNRLEGE